DRALARMDEAERLAVLRASLLPRWDADTLRAAFGDEAERVAGALRVLGLGEEPAPEVVQLLRERHVAASGSEGVRVTAEGAAAGLGRAGRWEEALALAARESGRPA